MLFQSNVMSSQLVQIAVEGPFLRPFTYRWAGACGQLRIGQRVLVPFGKGKRSGFYIGPADIKPNVEIKEVLRALEDQSLLPLHLVRLCVWIADYYLANPADCLLAALPPALKREAERRYIWSAHAREITPKVLRLRPRPGQLLSAAMVRQLQNRKGVWETLVRVGAVAEHWPEHDTSEQNPIDTLLVSPAVTPSRLDSLSPTSAQQAVLEEMLVRIDRGFSVTLLHGVTGSGKTLIYCKLIAEVIARGRQALLLTPEIALAGTTLAYVRGFFPNDVTILHSAMSESERLQSWRGIRDKRFRVVIGPRSALFAPLPDPGIVIVDEEHDSSYKQDEPSPRFHGRDTAVMLARLANVPALLGSATPSFESYYQAKTGKYTLLELNERATGAALPQVAPVDMRRERIAGDLSFLSHPLKRAIDAHLADHRQVILFLNRRGYAPQMTCADCGAVATCNACQIRLTYHRKLKRLLCHYCGFSAPAWEACPECQGHAVLLAGTGTQRVEEAIPRLFPTARVTRLDSDNTAGRKKLQQLLTAFAEGASDILLGTQMITKGLDLPNVTLVGVLAADQGSDLPDFRASERTFARLVQVSGRSGRASGQGSVLLQTWNTENPLLAEVARQNYAAFYEREIQSREAAGYPPFVRLANIVLSAPTEKLCQEASERFATSLRARQAHANHRDVIMGPAPCPFYRLRGLYRRHLIIKTRQILKLGALLRAWDEQEPRFGLSPRVRIAIDIDPQDIL